MKLTGYTYDCINLTNFEYEAHPMTGKRNRVNLLQFVISHQRNLFWAGSSYLIPMWVGYSVAALSTAPRCTRTPIKKDNTATAHAARHAAVLNDVDVVTVVHAAAVAAIVVAEAGAGVVGSGVALHAVVLVVLLLVLKSSRRGRHLQAIIAKPYTTRKPPWKQP